MHTEAFRYVVDIYALRGQRTVLVMQTLDWWLTATVVGISNKALLTVTLGGPSGIFTHSARGAGFLLTVIYQLTCVRGFSSVARLTATDL